MKNPLMKRIFLKSTIKRLEKKEKYLKIEKEYNLYGFLYRRLLATLIIFFVFLFLIPYGYIISPILSILYYKAMEYICFDYPIKKRIIRLNKEAPYFLEMLELSLGSNLTLFQAIKSTTKKLDGELSREFQRVIDEVQLGKSLNASLSDLQKRLPSSTLNRIILNIKTANEYGNNVTKVVQQELEYLQKEDYLKHKKEIVKIPFYVNLVSFLFIIVNIGLIVLLPIIHNMLK